MRILTSLIAAAIVAAATASAAAAQEPGRVTVLGEGRAVAAPDLAIVSLGVLAESDTARAAMDETSAAMSRLLAALGEAGVAAADVQTSGLSLNPIWRDGSLGGDPPKITGFAAQNTVTVRVRDIGALGGLLDRALSNGANSLHGVSFELQEPEPRRDAARAAAVADARRKAALYADAAGVELGRIVSISEDVQMAMPMPVFRMEAAMGGDVPVAAGEIAVTAQVVVVWEIGG